MYSMNMNMNVFFIFIFFQLCLSDAAIIKNINTRSCRNCIYYKIESLSDNYPGLNECIYFGEKNIQTDIIKYDYADSCRSSEDKCGLEGKYFEEQPNVELKYFIYNIKHYGRIGLLPTSVFIIYLFAVLHYKP